MLLRLVPDSVLAAVERAFGKLVRWGLRRWPSLRGEFVESVCDGALGAVDQERLKEYEEEQLVDLVADDRTFGLAFRYLPAELQEQVRRRLLQKLLLSRARP